MRRIAFWIGGAIAAVLTGLVAASLLHPDLTAQMVAHATPDVSPFAAWVVAHTHAAGGIVGAALASGPAVAIPAARDLAKILGEAQAIQDAHKGKPMPPAEAEKFEALCAEAAPLQAQVDRQKSIAAMATAVAEAKRLGQVVDATLPADGGETAEQKAAREADRARGIVGYISLGDLVSASPALADLKARNFPAGQMMELVRGLKKLDRRLIGLNRAKLEELKAGLAKANERKDTSTTVPTIDDLVIEPQRLPELLRVTEHDRLTVRDVINISRTTSNLIEFVRLVNYTRAAAAVAQGAAKPQAALEMDTVQAAVRTLAVWLPVNNQQLADLPQLAGLINGELLFDIDKVEEEEIIYGDGTGQHFSGIVNDDDVLTIGRMPDHSSRITSDDTLIDIIRRGITDVLVAGYQPNAVLVHPFDWEEILLEKGSDNRYVWIVVTEANVQRLWGVRVVETMATQDNQGFEVEQRHVIVGDFLRGATLFDREDSTISVGWINEQYIQNQRTILAEKRCAFIIKRPGAFRFHKTQDASAS